MCLQSSPWVLAKIKELNLKGRLVHGWTPPVVTLPHRERHLPED
jgi:hypothetical protein